MTFALLPSALLGPAVWEPVREILSDAGFEVIIAGRAGGRRDSVESVLHWYLDSMPLDRDYVLVPHSNAGLYVPALAQHRSVVGQVFVDAIVPPISGSIRVAPAGLLAMLGPMIDARGLVPVWTSWWDEETVAELFPSPAVRIRVEAEQTRFPLAYFEEIVTVADGWSVVPSGFIAFGNAYGEERTEATSRHWPTRTLFGGHLHLLIDPELVADTVTQLWSASNPSST